MEPSIVVYCGPMMASKTTRLFIDVERARFRRERIVVAKPRVDTRYDSECVVTHMGLKLPAIAVFDAAELELVTSAADFIAVDEAFMLPGCADVLVRARNRGASSSVSTLDVSASGEPFEESMRLLSVATEVIKLYAACVECSAPARATRSKTGSPPTQRDVRIGGHDIYEPVCWRHHPSSKAVTVSDSSHVSGLE